MSPKLYSKEDIRDAPSKGKSGVKLIQGSLFTLDFVHRRKTIASGNVDFSMLKYS